MPPEGVKKKEHSDIMSEDEFIAVIRAASELGINKIRFTGGEPLVKKNIISLCKRTHEISAIKEICMSTNGILLPVFAESLRASGVERVNISLDTLNHEKYSYITRGGSLDAALAGIRAAINAGFRVKINTVLMKGFNDDEIADIAAITLTENIDIRFIELMPMLEGFSEGEFMASQKIHDYLTELEPLETDGVARMFRLKNSLGNIGFISPITESFCPSCNRIRLTADGYIKPCLHSETEIFVRHKNHDEIKALIMQAVTSKPKRHRLNSNHHTQSLRTMDRIGG